MFRVLQVGKSGLPETFEGDDLVGPPPEGVLRWIDLEDQDDAQLKLLAERFGFHPLTIEDCSHFDQRPKLEGYDGYAFLVMHGFELRAQPNGHLHILELHSFLGDRYLVTVHAEPLASLNGVWNRIKADGATARRGVDFIRYLIADATVDACFPLVDELGTRIEEIEDVLLGRASGQDTLEEILQLKRLLVTLRKVLSPQRDVLA
jgi:magnesium transporter